MIRRQEVQARLGEPADGLHNPVDGAMDVSRSSAHRSLRRRSPGGLGLSLLAASAVLGFGCRSSDGPLRASSANGADGLGPRETSPLRVCEANLPEQLGMAQVASLVPSVSWTIPLDLDASRDGKRIYGPPSLHADGDRIALPIYLVESIGPGSPPDTRYRPESVLAISPPWTRPVVNAVHLDASWLEAGESVPWQSLAYSAWGGANDDLVVAWGGEGRGWLLVDGVAERLPGSPFAFTVSHGQESTSGAMGLISGETPDSIRTSSIGVFEDGLFRFLRLPDDWRVGGRVTATPSGYCFTAVRLTSQEPRGGSQGPLAGPAGALVAGTIEVPDLATAPAGTDFPELVFRDSIADTPSGCVERSPGGMYVAVPVRTNRPYVGPEVTWIGAPADSMDDRGCMIPLYRARWMTDGVLLGLKSNVTSREEDLCLVDVTKQLLLSCIDLGEQGVRRWDARLVGQRLVVVATPDWTAPTDELVLVEIPLSDGHL